MNVQKLTLDPSKWESSGMFKPRSKPRAFRHLHEDMRGRLRLREDAPEAVLREAAM